MTAYLLDEDLTLALTVVLGAASTAAIGFGLLRWIAAVTPGTHKAVGGQQNHKVGRGGGNDEKMRELTGQAHEGPLDTGRGPYL